MATSGTLTDRVALITGAAGGIGAETARRMAAQGARVVVADISDQQAAAITDELVAGGSQASTVHLDVASESDWRAAIEFIMDTVGRLDILVNNAGYFLGKGIEDATLDEWQQLVAVNMTGVFLGTKYCAPALRAAARANEHGSAVVNVSSIAGLAAAPNDPLYSMTKGGVSVFTKSMALCFAGEGDRVRVNSVHPGVVDTDMGALAIAAQASRLGVTGAAEIRQLSVERHPLGRIARTEDIANAIVFLASDEASFITGVNMPVDGGYTAG